MNDIRRNGARGEFHLLMNGQAHKVDMKAAGLHNIYNAIYRRRGVSLRGAGAELIRRGLSMFQPVGGRMEILRCKTARI